MSQSHPLHDVFAPRHASAAGSKRVGLVIPGRGERSVAKRLGRRLQAQDHFLPLLVSATLLTTLALVFIAYLTVRADVLASQQQQVSRDVHIAQEVLAGPSGSFALRSGQLVSVTSLGQVVLNAGGAQMVRVRELTGERSALYIMQGTGLSAVATDGLGAVGQSPAPEVISALIGDCGPLALPSCHHEYVGGVRLRDGEYTAAYVPLFDATGAFIGALGVGQPQSAVLAPAAQFTIVLLFVGLLVTLVVLAAGIWMYNVLSGEMVDALHLRLNHLATVAAELEHAANTQVVAARRQERMARQISDGARDIDTLVTSMKQGHVTMHDSATGIWAEMSQPGIAPDPTTAMRLARQAVVMAARIGVAAEDARSRCNHVVRLMNQVIAEGHVLSGHGHETERRAAELRGVVEQIERTLGEPLAPHASSPSRLSSLSTVPGLSESSPPPERSLVRAYHLARAYGERIGRYILTRAEELAGRAERVSTRHARHHWLFASRGLARTLDDAEPYAGADAGDAGADLPMPFSAGGAWDVDAQSATTDDLKTNDHQLPRFSDLPRRPDDVPPADGADESARPRRDNDTRPRR